MVPVRMNLDFGNLSNGKTNSIITCKCLENGKLFDDTATSVIFHSYLLRRLEFRVIFDRTPLFLENWATALHLLTFPYPHCCLGAWKHCSFPGAASQPEIFQLNRCSYISYWVFHVCVFSSLPCGGYPDQCVGDTTTKPHSCTMLNQHCSNL